MPVAFLVFMFVYDWRLSLICLIPILVGFGILYYMLKDESEGFVKQYQKSAEDISNNQPRIVPDLKGTEAKHLPVCGFLPVNGR